MLSVERELLDRAVNGNRHEHKEAIAELRELLRALLDQPASQLQPELVAPFCDDTVVCRRYQLEQSPGQNFYHYDLGPVYGSVPVTISELIALAESALVTEPVKGESQ